MVINDAAITNRIIPLHVIEELARNGNVIAQRAMGLAYATDAAPELRMAAVWFRMAAEQGDALSQNGYGKILVELAQTKEDYEEAAKWFSAATKSGYVKASMSLALILLNRDVPIFDPEQGRKLLLHAAASGHIPAQGEAAKRYWTGESFPRNRLKSLYWWRQGLLRIPQSKWLMRAADVVVLTCILIGIIVLRRAVKRIGA